jgi:imidazolonepropionase-like amidohydrolase
MRSVPDSSAVITCARVFDGDQMLATEDPIAVGVNGGVIICIGPLDEVAADLPDAPVHRFGNATLTPGFVDAHTHLTMPGDGTAYERAVLRSPQARFRQAFVNLRTHLEAGVTTVRDLGSHADFLSWAPPDELLIPRLLRYGRPVTGKAGHMHLFGGGVTTPEEARDLVQANVTRGSDGIKIASSGGGTLGTVPHAETLPRPVVEAAIAAAHELGKLSTVHALSLSTMRDAIEAGADGIEHLGFLDPEGSSEFDEELAALAIAMGVTFGSTLGCNDQFTHLPNARDADPDEYGEQCERTSYYIRNASRLREMGGRIAVATDAGWKHTYFGDIANEMRLLCLAGYTPLEVLHLATRFNARYLRLDHLIGGVREGLRADLAVLASDPTNDIEVTRNVLAVYRDGVRVAGVPAEANA